MKNKSKFSLLIVVLLILGIAMITGGAILELNTPNEELKKDNETDKNNNEKNETSEWKKYDDIEHYEFGMLEAVNLDDIEVKMEKINFETSNGTKGTLDFSSSSFIPSYFSTTGFEGSIYMGLCDNFDLEYWRKEHSTSDSSIFDGVLEEEQEIKFYTADKNYAYANVLLQVGDSCWVIGVNIESRSIEEAVDIFKKLIPIAVEYDSSAPTIEEFTSNLVKQVKFNVEEISLEDINVFGIALIYKNTSNGIRVSSLGTSFYNSYTRIKDDYVSIEIPISLPSTNKAFDEVLEKEINGIPVRLYRKKESYKDILGETIEYYLYNVGFIQNNKEYLLDVYKTNSDVQIDEQKIIDFLNKIIK